MLFTAVRFAALIGILALRLLQTPAYRTAGVCRSICFILF